MKSVYWWLLSILPALLGCIDYMINDAVTPKFALGLLIGYLILFFTYPYAEKEKKKAKGES